MYHRFHGRRLLDYSQVLQSISANSYTDYPSVYPWRDISWNAPSPEYTTSGDYRSSAPVGSTQMAVLALDCCPSITPNAQNAHPQVSTLNSFNIDLCLNTCFCTWSDKNYHIWNGSSPGWSSLRSMLRSHSSGAAAVTLLKNHSLQQRTGCPNARKAYDAGLTLELLVYR